MFSTSQDHRQGGGALAGCVLVDMDNIKVINRSSKYKNKYVHRRSSVSLEGLTTEQIEDRRKLGLVRYSLQAPIEESSESEKDSPDCKPQIKYQQHCSSKKNKKSPASRASTGASHTNSDRNDDVECAENEDYNVLQDEGTTAGTAYVVKSSGSNNNCSTSPPSSPSSVFQNLVPSWISGKL